jgi:16S rRNA (guanine(966)-N(2))-methyltransferase RsmD
MKITAGRLKGKKIRFDLSRHKLRPTPSKVKESLFNIIGNSILNARFLDLYAGTGAIGIEALSRGASEVVFVEASRGFAMNIKNVIKEAGLTVNAKIINKKALQFIMNNPYSEENPFDIIFLDPPYHTDELLKAINAIKTSGLLRQGGILIAEHFTKIPLPESFGSLKKKRDYKYGDTVLSLYLKEQKDI